MAEERPRGDDRPRGDCVSRRAERDPATVSAPRILTFGCRLNAYESDVMRRHAEAAGLDNTIIVNTCAVTGEAERQARQASRKARRENPDPKINGTGCGAQDDPARESGKRDVGQGCVRRSKTRWRQRNKT